MLFSKSSIIAVAALFNRAASHGIITIPYPRAVGDASLAACGSGVTNLIKADNTSHVEGLPEAAAADTAYNAKLCNLWLCKGLQFADNTANVEAYYPGQVVPINVFIRVPHEGTANVSIVDTTVNEVLGSELIYWDRYADQALAVLPANNSAFEITIPRDLEGKCLTAGQCVIQWWWYGIAAKQTYESCIDFVLKPLVAPIGFRRM